MAQHDDHARALVSRACETDDTTLLKEAVRSVDIDYKNFLPRCVQHQILRCGICPDDIETGREKAFEAFQQDILRQALNNKSMSIVTHLLDDGFKVPDQVLVDLIKNDSVSTLGRLIACGVSVQKLPPWELGVDCSNVSETTLEFLLAHGWDINYRHVDQNMRWPDHEHSKEAEPYMWRIVKNHARVKWCLEHGASVHPRDFQPYKQGDITSDQYYCEPILEVAACQASVATFELLRSHGAPLGRRTLHRAVEFACRSNPPYYARMTPTDRQVRREPWITKPWKKDYQKLHEWQNKEQNEEQSEKHDEKQSEEGKEIERIKAAHENFVRNHEERMAMLRHLIDIVGLDVNADDKPPGGYRLLRPGTPMEYIVDITDIGKDTRDITWLLLDRGADPTPVYQSVKRKGYCTDSPETLVFEHVEAWKKARKPKKECCVQ
jgi:hypothetical protein